jgi:hypothetical protein
MEIIFELEKISVDALIYPLIADLPRIIKLYPINNIPHSFKTKEYPIRINIYRGDNYSIGVKLIHIKRWATINDGNYSDAIIKAFNKIEKHYRSRSRDIIDPSNRKYPLYQLLENVFIADVFKTVIWKEYVLVFVKTYGTRLIIIRDDIIIYQSIDPRRKILVRDLLADMNAGRSGLLELPIERIKSAKR